MVKVIMPSQGTSVSSAQWLMRAALLFAFVFALGGTVVNMRHGADILWKVDVVKDPQQPAQNSLKATTITAAAADAKPKQEYVMQARERTTTNSTTTHHPDYFSSHVPLVTLMTRMNLISDDSGCSIATWFFEEPNNPTVHEDCKNYAKRTMRKEFIQMKWIERRRVTTETVANVEANDTIYVPFVKLESFVNNALPLIQADFVLITGQSEYVAPFSSKIFDTLVQNPHVIHWFTMNIPMYAADPLHPKLSPFPYGLDAKKIPDFQTEVRMYNETKKYRLLYVPDENYNLRILHRSRYVLSPNAAESHRPYEAIALGTVPVTPLNSDFFRHLSGNVIFENTQWETDQLEATLPQYPRVNRRMMFEEYWMEYVETIVGRPLRWWDPSRRERCVLADMVAASRTAEVNLRVGHGMKKAPLVKNVHANKNK